MVTIIHTKAIRDQIGLELAKLKEYIEGRVNQEARPNLNLGYADDCLSDAIVLYGNLVTMQKSIRCPRPQEDDDFDISLDDI